MDLIIGFILGCITILAIKTYYAFKDSKNRCVNEEPKTKQKVVRDDYDDDDNE